MATQQTQPCPRSTDKPKVPAAKPVTVVPADASESTGGSAADQADALKEVGDENAPGSVKRKEAT